MILLSGQPAKADEPDLITVEFPAYAQTVDGEKRIPVWRFFRPSSATMGAAHAASRGVLPARDEGEDEAAFLERAKLSLAAIGVANPEGLMRLGWDATLHGILMAVAVVNTAIALTHSWEGFGDKTGEVEPTADAICTALRIPAISDKVDAALRAYLGPVLSEGNV